MERDGKTTGDFCSFLSFTVFHFPFLFRSHSLSLSPSLPPKFINPESAAPPLHTLQPKITSIVTLSKCKALKKRPIIPHVCLSWSVVSPPKHSLKTDSFYSQVLKCFDFCVSGDSIMMQEDHFSKDWEDRFLVLTLSFLPMPVYL